MISIGVLKGRSRIDEIPAQGGLPQKVKQYIRRAGGLLNAQARLIGMRGRVIQEIQLKLVFRR